MKAFVNTDPNSTNTCEGFRIADQVFEVIIGSLWSSICGVLIKWMCDAGAKEIIVP